MRVASGFRNLGLLVIGATGMAWGALAPGAGTWAESSQVSKQIGKLSFSRDIMPILSDKCFKCHGPDSETRMADLRLDTPESVFAVRAGHAVIVRGHPDQSALVSRITRHEMPPPGSGKSLDRDEIATLTRWVAEGAPYGKLWSFEPVPASVPVPAIQSPWVHDALDKFVLSRLKRSGLNPSPAASPLRWLRRVTYDLTGLPPTEAEISNFESDKSPQAFDRVVDRLLASPHFGERTAVDWLDAARYSDSYGYQSDLLSPTWPYRDWVIKAFNQNLPYNQFLLSQIAGDLLPHPSQDERLATAFNRLHRQTNEGGSIALEFQTEYAADRVATYGSAVLGLTLGCARCHDHKFDPITQKEYYQLFAYFNSIKESGLLLSTEIVPTPSMLLPTPAEQLRLQALRKANEAARQALKNAILDSLPRYLAWRGGKPIQAQLPDVLAQFNLDDYAGGKFSSSLPGKPFGAKLLKVDLVPGRKGMAVQFDGENGVSFRELPGRDRWDAFTWSFWINDPRQTTAPMILQHRTGGTDVGFCGFDVMLENGYLTARVMRQWPGNGIGVRTTHPIPQNEWTHVAWSWDGFGRAEGLKIYINGKPAETTVLNDRIWKKIRDYGDLGPSNGDWTFGQRFRDAGFKGGKLDEVTFAERALSDLEVAQLFDGNSFNNALTSNSAAAAAGLQEYYLSALDGPVRAACADVRKAQEDLANFEEGILEVSVMEDTPKPVPAYLLARGNYDAPRNARTVVQRNVPACLPPLFEGKPRAGQSLRTDRLALAYWTIRDDNPLTARVAVNRVWQMLFGTGIVETSENFGVQGSRPANRELLDYLAREFIDSGWNLKGLIRRIVLSSTYRQDSARSKGLLAKDPENHLFSRGPSHRLSAEEIRDTALAAAGLINLKVGGPPVNPYQPAGIWRENNTMSPEFVQSKGSDLYRRSIYSTWKRTTPVPSMMLFDATSREACAIRRQMTNTPLQALVLLNDIQFVEAARVLAERAMRVADNDEARLRLVFRRLSGREPDDRELAILQDTLGDQRSQFKNDAASAKKLVKIGDSVADPKFDPSELAALTATVQVVMNSDSVVWER